MTSKKRRRLAVSLVASYLQYISPGLLQECRRKEEEVLGILGTVDGD